MISKLSTTLIAVLLALSQSAFAAEPPSAGGQLQQIPPLPITQKVLPEIRVEQSNMPAIAISSHAKILVNSLHLTGELLYSEAELLALTGFRPGGELTLNELRIMAAKIAAHYHSNGYFVAQAYLPAQDIKDGAVTIVVLEGHYGNVNILNESNLSDNLVNNLLGGLNPGDLIAAVPIETRLLLLSDLPGVEIKSVLIPGVSLGTTDLMVDINQGKRISGEVDADNAGNRYTGRYRLGATVNLNEPAGHGDVATLRAMTSGSGLYYVRASYQLQTGKATVGVAYSILGYHLGEEFAALDANGTAQIMSIYGSYPLIRTRSTNLHVQLTYEDKTFQDRVDSISSVTDKTAHLLMVGLYGDHRDTFGGGGYSSLSLIWTAGSIDIQTPFAYSVDAATAQTNGPYNKVGYNAMRLQRVTDILSLYGAINGQFAMKNLDVSEKMELGGMYAVRAYPEGEAYADEGFVLTLEARLLLPKFPENLPGRIHLIGLIDTGMVTINKNPWTSEPNHRTLSGAGVGLTWEEYNNFSVKAYYAHKLGNEAATSGPDSPGQFWIQLVKYF